MVRSLRADWRKGIPVSAIVWPRRTAQVAAVVFGVFTLGIGLASVPIDGLLHQTGPGGAVIDWLVSAVPMVSAAAVGTLVAARRPGNPVGWMLLAIFLFAAAPAAEYARLDYRVHHGTLPFGGAGWCSVRPGRCSWSCSWSCCGCFPMGGCRRAGGGVWPGFWSLRGCWPGWRPRPEASR